MLTSATPTFYSWLIDQKQRKDEIGRLAAEAFRDKTFPRTSRKLHVFLGYYDPEPRNRAAIKKAHAEWRILRRVAA